MTLTVKSDYGTLNSWLKMCGQKIMLVSDEISKQGFKINATVDAIEKPETPTWKVETDYDNRTINHHIVIDKTCFDNASGANPALEKLDKMFGMERVVSTVYLSMCWSSMTSDFLKSAKQDPSLVNIDDYIKTNKDQCGGVICECVEKSSALFEPMVEWSNIESVTAPGGGASSGHKHRRIAGGYGDTVVVGLSEYDLINTLELETTKVFS